MAHTKLLLVLAAAMLSLTCNSTVAQQPAGSGGPQLASLSTNQFGFDPNTYGWTDPNNWVDIPGPSWAPWWMTIKDPAARAYRAQALKAERYCYYPVPGWGSSRTVRIPSDTLACRQVAAFNPTTFPWTNPASYVITRDVADHTHWKLIDPTARAFMYQSMRTGQWCELDSPIIGYMFSIRVPQASGLCNH